MNQLMTIIEWWVVPIILFCFLTYLFVFIPEEDASPLIKASTKSGKVAGLVVLSLFIISRKTSEDVFSFTIPNYSFDFLSTIAATVIGFLIFLGFSSVKSTRFLGLVAFVLSSAVSITIYSYFYINQIRSTVVFWTLGITLGILLKRMVFPELDPRELEGSTDKVSVEKKG